VAMRSARAMVGEPRKNDDLERTHDQKRRSNSSANADPEPIGDRTRIEEPGLATNRSKANSNVWTYRSPRDKQICSPPDLIPALDQRDRETAFGRSFCLCHDALYLAPLPPQGMNSLRTGRGCGCGIMRASLSTENDPNEPVRSATYRQSPRSACVHSDNLCSRHVLDSNLALLTITFS
jgi:hypothetical protein